MDQAFSMFDVMALIAVAVGSLGVINTLTMSVIERTQEIGMLRAVGMTRGQVVRMVLAEAGLMGLFGGILGSGDGNYPGADPVFGHDGHVWLQADLS